MGLRNNSSRIRTHVGVQTRLWAFRPVLGCSDPFVVGDVATGATALDVHFLQAFLTAVTLLIIIFIVGILITN